jgi:arylsulfatase A-like enzyme
MYEPEKMTPLAGWIDTPLPRDIEFSAGYFPNAKLTLPALKRIMAHYYATISEIDFHVGRMVDALKRKGLYDSTMIVYTADHGEYMGFHHLVLKGNLGYDPLMKVPLIAKYPGGAGRGTVSDALVSAVDLAPTILRQAGCRPDEKMRGLDLAAPTTGSNATRTGGGREIVFSEMPGAQQLVARTAGHKLILRSPREKSLFFDLKADPLEMENLYGRPQCQAEVERLAKAIEDWRGPAGPTRAYLDENAPVINQPNVPKRDDNHRQEMAAYFQRKLGLAPGKP